MAIDKTIQFRLDDEQRARARDCLSKEGIWLPADRFQRFTLEIENSITAHLAAEPEGNRPGDG